MADSQLKCLDDDHVNEKISESKPEYYYSEEQRAALEQLLKNGDGAFKMRLKEDNVRDFLSAREVKWILRNFQEYGKDSDSDTEQHDSTKESNADSGVHSTYWPQMSDTEVPPLDMGWPGSSGYYKGTTRVSVYSHPPKENGPCIKEVVRRLIQEAHQMVAVVMDLLTDLQILQDLLDAGSKRGVAIYIVLETQGVPHFLDMCSRLQISAVHLRKLRVRTVSGSGLALSTGKLPGSLCSKYMLVDGEKVMFGSYSFTWSSSRVDRNTITVLSGQVVDTFDSDFRELYAASEEVDLHKEFNISRPPMPAPAGEPPQRAAPPLPVSSSRFQVALGDSRQAGLKVPAHKYHNPKYTLVVGNSLGHTGSLQDLSTVEKLTGQSRANGTPHKKVLLAKGGGSEEADGLSTPTSGSPGQEKEASDKTPAFGEKKQRSSFRLFLKGRSSNHGGETLVEGVASPPNPAHTRKRTETNSTATDELEDSFEIIEKPSLPKLKNKKSLKLTQRSISMQTISTAQEEGTKGHKRHQKKNCIQS